MQTKERETAKNGEVEAQIWGLGGELAQGETKQLLWSGGCPPSRHQRSSDEPGGRREVESPSLQNGWHPLRQTTAPDKGPSGRTWVCGPGMPIA